MTTPPLPFPGPRHVETLPPILMASIPALEVAAHDKRLNPFEKAALLWAYHTPLLNVVQFRPLKVETLRFETGLATRTALNALHLFTEMGYFECGYQNPAAPAEAQGRRPSWYRLAIRLPVARAA